MRNIEVSEVLEAFAFQKMKINIDGELVNSEKSLHVKMGGDDIAIVTNDEIVICYIDVTSKTWKYAFTPEGVELLKPMLKTYFHLIIDRF